ncbi:HEPN domain-containing protein [Mycobacterium terramassiliense]|nr:HEPN domain-containing protein [Mycobacterium terramassiliense]
MSTIAAVGGEFWTPENPSVRVGGVFTAQVGQQAEVTLQSGLVAGVPTTGPPPIPAPRPDDVAGLILAAASGAVARLRPITIHGELDGGEPVTLFDAPNWNRPGVAPRHVAPITVFGANTSIDQGYCAVRFRIDHPHWLGHLTGGESSVVEDDKSTLSVEVSEGGNWLVYESSAPATIERLEIRAISGCLALAQLALYPDEDLVIPNTQVRVDADSPWLTVHGPGFCAVADSLRPATLLPREELTVERFGSWIALNAGFDGLAWAVARRLEVPVQLQVQLFTSLVEGLHRRLPFNQWRFPEVPDVERKSALRKIRRVAREAAVAEAETLQLDWLDPVTVRQMLADAVSHIGEVSYQERAEAVVDAVLAAVPEIGESIDGWPDHLKDLRNAFAHQLLQDDEGESIEDRRRRWTIVSRLAAWLLRTLLLLRVGVEPELLREKYLQNENFAFYRANLGKLIKELGWEDPPQRRPVSVDDD